MIDKKLVIDMINILETYLDWFRDNIKAFLM